MVDDFADFDGYCIGQTTMNCIASLIALESSTIPPRKKYEDSICCENEENAILEWTNVIQGLRPTAKQPTNLTQLQHPSRVKISMI